MIFILNLDEITSLVIDIGSKYLRIGYSGNDRPSIVVPSWVGVSPAASKTDGDSPSSPIQPILYFDDLSLYAPRAGMEIKPVISNNDGTENHLKRNIF